MWRHLDRCGVLACPQNICDVDTDHLQHPALCSSYSLINASKVVRLTNVSNRGGTFPLYLISLNHLRELRPAWMGTSIRFSLFVLKDLTMLHWTVTSLLREPSSLNGGILPKFIPRRLPNAKTSFKRLFGACRVLLAALPVSFEIKLDS